MSFLARLDQASARIGARLAEAIATLPESDVRAAMAYAVEGGKGLRGFMVLEGAALHGVDPDDDLPAMDNDALRRGRPTVHIAWNEAVAVLAGDALQSLAFELITLPGQPHPGPMALALARGAGAAGMVYGQALDIAAETAATPLTLAQITRLQAGKTGALFEWAATAGPRLSGADCAAMAQYAAAFGLAFQIADDILDHEGDAAMVGKRLQKDAARGKATFVSLLGLEAARARAHALAQEACAALEAYGPAADPLREAARFAVTRNK